MTRLDGPLGGAEGKPDASDFNGLRVGNGPHPTIRPTGAHFVQDLSLVTPEMLGAAWGAWHSRHGGKLGPGPAFAEAIAAALAVAPALPRREGA